MCEIQIGVFRRVRISGRVRQQIEQNPARIIHQIAKTLRHQHRIYIPRRGLFQLFQIVIRQGLPQGYFDGR